MNGGRPLSPSVTWRCVMVHWTMEDLTLAFMYLYVTEMED